MQIDFTCDPVEKRTVRAEMSPAYFIAPVKVKGTYRLYNTRPPVLEHLIHRVFADPRLDAAVINEVGGAVGTTE